MNLKGLMSPLINVVHKASAMTLSYASDVGDRAAAHYVGQFLLQKTEDLIWSVEKSIQWSLPSDDKTSSKQTGEEVEQNGQHEMNGQVGKIETMRPLPWVFFIPVLIVWRCVRLGYETVSFMIGNTPVKPADVVHFLRNQRRNLRTVRIRGKRAMMSQDTTPTAFSKLRSFVQQVLSRAVCFTGLDTQQEEARTCVAVTARSELAASEEQEQEDTENVLDKLNRLSREEDDIDHDPDFEPAETSMSSGGTTTSDDYATEEEPGDASVARSPFLGDEVITEEDESSDAEDSQQPLEDANHASSSPQYQTATNSEEDVSFASARSTDSCADLVENQDSALQKLSNIFMKKT